MCATCPAHHIFLDSIAEIYYGNSTNYEISLLYYFCHPTVISCFLGQHVLYKCIRCCDPHLEMFCFVTVTVSVYNTDRLLTSQPFHLSRQVKMKDTHTKRNRDRTKEDKTTANKKYLLPNLTCIWCRPRDQPFNQRRNPIPCDSGQFCRSEICRWEDGRERQGYRRNEIDFSSFRLHLSFFFLFYTLKPCWDFSFITTHIT